MQFARHTTSDLVATSPHSLQHQSSRSTNATNSFRGPAARMVIFLIALNIAVWVWAFLLFHPYPILLGTSFLAYSLGLRHAVDADHIAAIDNVTRKLIQEGKRPVTTGFFFSFGHSTVVLVGSILIATSAVSLQKQLHFAHLSGRLVGTIVSSAFLFMIAAINLVVLHSIYRSFVRVSYNAKHNLTEMTPVANHGFLTRILAPFIALISKSWHMFPLGILFGFSFDTTTEVGLLGISALEATNGLPIWSILVFPALFAVGMSLIDTADNLFMLVAYGWAFTKPIRKLYYNITITFISVLIAFGIGSLEILGLYADHYQPAGGIWTLVRRLNDSFYLVGYAVIVLFVLCWIVSLAIFKWMRIDHPRLVCKQPCSGQS
jgi:high-affinity nickel-transport protein